MFRHRGLKKKGQYKSGGMGYYYDFTTTIWVTLSLEVCCKALFFCSNSSFSVRPLVFFSF